MPCHASALSTGRHFSLKHRGDNQVQVSPLEIVERVMMQVTVRILAHHQIFHAIEIGNFLSDPTCTCEDRCC